LIRHINDNNHNIKPQVSRTSGEVFLCGRIGEKGTIRKTTRNRRKRRTNCRKVGARRIGFREWRVHVSTRVRNKKRDG